MHINFLFGIFMTAVLCCTSHSSAEEICFKDLRSYKKIQSKLPAPIYKLPNFFIFNSFMGKAGIKLAVNSKGISFDIYSNIEVESPPNIKSICLISDKKFIIKYVNDREDEYFECNSKSCNINNLDFEITGEWKFIPFTGDLKPVSPQSVKSPSKS